MEQTQYKKLPCSFSGICPLFSLMIWVSIYVSATLKNKKRVIRVFYCFNSVFQICQDAIISVIGRKAGLSSPFPVDMGRIKCFLADDVALKSAVKATHVAGVACSSLLVNNVDSPHHSREDLRTFWT
jgi:hypothetical protein